MLFRSPFKVLLAMKQAKKLIEEFKPDILLTAGGFVAFPVARACAKANIPVFIHHKIYMYFIILHIYFKLCEI